jgi:hypothetical protein
VLAARSQSLEHQFPPDALLPEEVASVCNLSFPDTNSSAIGDQTFCFRLRMSPRSRRCRPPARAPARRHTHANACKCRRKSCQGATERSTKVVPVWLRVLPSGPQRVRRGSRVATCARAAGRPEPEARLLPEERRHRVTPALRRTFSPGSLSRAFACSGADASALSLRPPHCWVPSTSKQDPA